MRRTRGGPRAPCNRVTEPSLTYTDAAELRAALRRLTHATEQVTRQHKLTPRRYELLLFVQSADEAGSPATVTALCEPLQTTQGSVTQLVDAAVQAGLLKRRRAPHDRRSSTLHLTALGRKRLESVFNALGPERSRIAAVVAPGGGQPAR